MAAATAPGTAIIGADVGGTYARLGWASPRPGEPLQVRGFRTYTCADHPSLAAILRDYAGLLAQDPAVPPVARATVAIAGLLDGDRLLNTNLAWPVSLAGTRGDAGVGELELINDFAAVAQAIAHADPARCHRLSADDGQAAADTPALVLGPGTGLGVALRLENGHPPVLASEAGHAALAPGNTLELDVLRLLMQRHGHVDSERILSGPGLVALHSCLCELRGEAVRWHSPTELVQAANGHDPQAVESIRLFCGWLGSVAGDLALAFGARSVHLTGGITGHLATWLHEGDFIRRFLAKGALSPALHRVSVWRVEHGQLGVLGALAWPAGQGGDLPGVG